MKRPNLPGPAPSGAALPFKEDKTMRAILILVGGVCLLSICACAKEGASQDTAPPSRPAATAAPSEVGGVGHASPAVKPGTHEDWCGEHQVPESLCTRCNPALAAAFKASGDWCEEHGLPESQCLACNPDLKIERPPKAEGG
jgi:hypothetical protein